MIRHVVLLSWNEKCTDAAVQAVTDGLAALPGQIPEIRFFILDRLEFASLLEKDVYPTSPINIWEGKRMVHKKHAIETGLESALYYEVVQTGNPKGILMPGVEYIFQTTGRIDSIYANSNDAAAYGEVFLEAKLTDTVTDELIAATIRKVSGSKMLKNTSEKLELEHLRADLEKMGNDIDVALTVAF